MSHLRKRVVLLAMANHTPAQSTTGPIMLEEPGQAAFGTLQEMIRHLEADPTTDWSKVDLEGLRQHLRDMSAVTLDVDVADPVVVPMGLQLLVQPKTPLVAQALSRLFQHTPPHGYRTEVGPCWCPEKRQAFVLHRLSYYHHDHKPRGLAKVRALGYIGWITSGNHPVMHHWGMATGTLYRHPFPQRTPPPIAPICIYTPGQTRRSAVT